MKLEIIENNVIPNNKNSILFVHGMWHGAWCWEDKFLPYFEEKGYKSYAFSFSNHGKSEKKKHFNKISINDYVNELEEVILSLNTSPILVGHSMGAFVIQKYLEKHNNSPGAVLLSPVAPFGVLVGSYKAFLNSPISFLKTILTFNLKHIINQKEKYNKFLFSNRVNNEVLEKAMKKLVGESFRAYMDMIVFNLVKTNKITTPIKVIGSKNDNAVPLWILKKTASIYKVEPVIFEDVCHNAMLDPQYSKVADEIIFWINKLVK